MLLSHLGGQLAKALRTMSGKTVLDDTVLQQFVKDLSLALITADVNIHLVKSITDKIKKIDLASLPAGRDKRKHVKKALAQELLQLLGGNPSQPQSQPHPPTSENCFEPTIQKKGQVVLLVGLNGCGKTTTATKYAYHYKKRGLKTALVAADCFRAGAFDQLKQNAMKAKIPFYGSYTERDPAIVAREGVALFRQEGMHLIVVDTAGRSSQDSALLEEMKELVKVTRPDEIIYVVDGSIGQSAKEQAQAFQAAVPVASVIITKLDNSNTKGGGALTAVAETKSRVVFVGTGEHIEQLEVFDPHRFVGRLMGWGDLQGLLDCVVTSSSFPQEEPKLMKKLMEEKKPKFTFRDLYEQIQMMKGMPLQHMMSLLPTMGDLKKQDVFSPQTLKRCLICMDSMTQVELDGDSKLFTTQPQRTQRICRGSGSTAEQVHTLFTIYKMFATTMTKINFPSVLKSMASGKMNQGREGKGGKGGGADMMAGLQSLLSSQGIQGIPPHLLASAKGLLSSRKGRRK